MNEVMRKQVDEWLNARMVDSFNLNLTTLCVHPHIYHARRPLWAVKHHYRARPASSRTRDDRLAHSFCTFKKKPHISRIHPSIHPFMRCWALYQLRKERKISSQIWPYHSNFHFPFTSTTTRPLYIVIHVEIDQKTHEKPLNLPARMVYSLLLVCFFFFSACFCFVTPVAFLTSLASGQHFQSFLSLSPKVLCSTASKLYIFSSPITHSASCLQLAGAHTLFLHAQWKETL